MTTTLTMSALDVLRTAREMIDTPEKWWQSHGHNYGVPDIVCTCLGLAISEQHAPFHARNSAEALLARVIGHGDIYEYNDNHTHEEVLATVDKAIAIALAGA